MSFDGPQLIFGFIFSGVGFVYMSYGKKMQRLSYLLCGVTLMIYPYFTDSLAPLIGIGAVLSAVPWFIP